MKTNYIIAETTGWGKPLYMEHITGKEVKDKNVKF